MAASGPGSERHQGPRPGDVFVRPVRIRRQRLRRVLSVPALFSIGYGNVGSSIYYALGLTAVAALGATPLALALAGLFFIFTALTYAEGAALFPEAGGSASFARHAFNELASFVAAWALMLEYVVTISISVYTVAPYLGYFYLPLKENPNLTTAVAIGVVGALALLNVIGIRETAIVNVAAAVFDIALQATLILLGLTLLFNLDTLAHHITDFWPSTSNLAYGVSIAMVAYIGLESVAQVSEEARVPERRIPRAMLLIVLTVILMYAGVSVAALSAMSPQELATTWATDPVAGIAHHLPLRWLQGLMAPLVAVLAASILIIAANAGLLGVTRLAYSMSTHQHLPGPFGYIHSRFRTPYIAILVFSFIAILVLIPGFFNPEIFFDLGALYGFGAMTAFTMAHASIIALRWRQPQLPRPFKPWGTLRLGEREVPLTAVMGILGTAAVLVVVVLLKPYGRWVGFGWMFLGLLLYVGYRLARRLPMLSEPGSSSTP